MEVPGIAINTDSCSNEDCFLGEDDADYGYLSNNK